MRRPRSGETRFFNNKQIYKIYLLYEKLLPPIRGLGAPTPRKETRRKEQVNEKSEEIIKGGGDRVVDWIWRLCNMTIESCVAPEDWRSAVIVPLYKGRRERTESKN